MEANPVTGLIVLVELVVVVGRGCGFAGGGCKGARQIRLRSFCSGLPPLTNKTIRRKR